MQPERHSAFALNISGKLLTLDTPLVMGILNATPDSFYAGSRCGESDEAIVARAGEILDEGGSIIDIGACSTRPGAGEVSPEEEWRRMEQALSLVRRHYPDAIVSVDTFRAEIARRSVEQYGAQIVNDISGGEMDDKMFDTVAALHVPYILTHMRGTPQNMQEHTDYDDLLADMTAYFAERIDRLRRLGVCDIVLDPGFGFGKSLDGNYTLLRRLGELQALGLPLLAGVSRKSMIYNLLGCTPNESLNGTTALHAIALLNGAKILRVHDVREAVETIKIVTKTQTA